MSRQTSTSTAPGADTATHSPAGADSSSSKARLEAAKEAYKAAKEEYRKEREVRRASDREARRSRNVSGERYIIIVLLPMPQEVLTLSMTVLNLYLLKSQRKPKRKVFRHRPRTRRL